jgi:NADH-quinone oxidoreductase subunit G
MAFVKIDDKELEVANGTTILEAAKEIGVEIPHYCYHSGMSIVASCRMCLVKVQGMPKLTPACSTRIGQMPPEKRVDGKYDMVIFTGDNEVKEAQESILEFLLLNHPVDCPECDQAGECLLQDYSYKYGKDRSRFEFAKQVPPRKDLGPNMLLITTRCILCSRCVRFTREISGTDELMIRNRGAQSEIDLFPGESLNNKLSMNTADVCPVGALVTKDFLFKPRNWRYDRTRSICPGCSVGCNVEIEYLPENNRMYRIKPVYNADVNEWWMCDDGRLLYHAYNKLERLEYPMVRKNGELQRGHWRLSLKSVVNKLKEFSADQVAFVGSGYATNEENYLLRKIAREGVKTGNVALDDKFYREDDIVYKKFTIKGEKLPNYQGAADMLKTGKTFSAVLKEIDKGKIKALYYLGGSPFFTLTDADLEILKKLDYLAVQDICKTPLSEIADAVLPGASAYEKDGTFTNYKHHVQRIRSALLPPAAAKTDFDILQELLGLFDLAKAIRPQKTFEEITAVYADYNGISYSRLGTQGSFKGRKVEAEAVS